MTTELDHDIIWHEYNVNDEKTYPPHRARCLTQGASGGLSVRTFFSVGDDIPPCDDYIGPGFGTEDGYDIRQPVRYAVIRESLVIEGS